MIDNNPFTVKGQLDFKSNIMMTPNDMNMLTIDHNKDGNKTKRKLTKQPTADNHKIDKEYFNDMRNIKEHYFSNHTQRNYFDSNKESCEMQLSGSID